MKNRNASSYFVIVLVIWFALLSGCSQNVSRSASGFSGSSGKSGSMARFTITGDYLYAVSDRRLHVFNLEDKSKPQAAGDFSLGWGIETIFSYKNLLFFGTRTGMLIYEISTPANPRFLSQYRHVYSCDPVVVEKGRAYVTLRNQAGCRQGKNELQIYDIVDPTVPLLIKTYQMKNPWGLGIDGNKLFVCDGRYGLKVFNVADPENLKLLETVEYINGYDVIPNNNILIVSARDGIYQFDNSTNRLEKLSRIPVGY